DFYFASGYYEAEAGLYILGPRTYDPSLGRFLQKDPLAGSLLDLVSQNEYVYANNDPVNKIDPTGHRAEIASVGQSAKAIAASARAAARQMGVVVTEKKKEIADLEADPLSSPDDLLAARGALAAALESKEAMLELAKNNEEDVARREAREIEEALADAAWQASLQSVAAPVLEATTTPEIVPSVEIAPLEVPVESPQPPIVEDPGPVSFLRDASGFVSESLYKLVPKVEAKKKKAKKPKPPPPPKKVVKKEAPKKLSKAELRKLEKQEKEEKALKDLKSTSKVQASSAAVVVTQKKGSTPAPSTAAVSQGIKQQMSTLSVAPSVATTKTSSATKLVSAPSAVKVSQISVSLVASINAQAEKLAKDIAAVRAKQAAENARAVALAAQLVANGKAKVTPVVNSSLVKNAQYGLAACSFEPTIVGGTCGLVDGVLYLLQGNSTSAGLSFGGALPLGAGFAYDTSKAARVAEDVSKVGKTTMTQWGWSGTAVWKNFVTTIGKGGTIENLAGKVPTKSEAVTLIGEAKGKIDRIEGPHAIPNPHVYNHINYTTESGLKGTIRIQDL
ncbi:MAG: RHS repeat-associated core domain-containing protein, partial [Rectinemataceae bacterium]|nr:RHS repeat-associated core domain-containing protein [Rectinemataceae bacterium]